jgi:hypothetical protein
VTDTGETEILRAAEQFLEEHGGDQDDQQEY